VEIAGKVLGVVGCGRIGQVVASSAATMGMEVIGYDPVMTANDFKEAGIKKVGMPCTPLSAATACSLTIRSPFVQ
jgi:phosphoglycerate dehydrogenase-like enzyme